KVSQLFLDLDGKSLDLAKIGPEDFHAEDAAESGRQHFGTRLDRHPENVGHTGRLNIGVDLGEQFFPSHSAPPLIGGFKRDDGLEHRQWRGDRWRLSLTGLAAHGSGPEIFPE